MRRWKLFLNSTFMTTDGLRGAVMFGGCVVSDGARSGIIYGAREDVIVGLFTITNNEIILISAESVRDSEQHSEVNEYL